MPQKPNKLLRVVLTTFLVLGGIAVGAAVLVNSSRSAPTAAPSNTASTPAGAAAAPQPAAPAPGVTPPAAAPPQANQAPTTGPTTPSISGGILPAPPTYKAKTFPISMFTSIGSIDPASQFEMEVKVSPLGAGIESLALTNEYTTIYQAEHEQLQGYHVNKAAPSTGAAPLAVMGLEIDGVTVALGATGKDGETFWSRPGRACSRRPSWAPRPLPRSG